MNIFKMKRSFLITEATANSSSRCIQNLSKFIHSMSLDVAHAYLWINDLRKLCKGYPQLTTGHCIEKWSGTSAVRVQFYISGLLTSDLQFHIQVNAGSFGATEVTKYLKLSKITNFSWLGFDAVPKIVVFHNLR